MVMRTGAKIRLLRNDAVLSDRDISDTIKRYLVANPTKITNDDLPREGNANPRPDQNIATHRGPEEPPNEPSPRIKRLRCRPHKERVEQPPKVDEPSGSPPGSLRQ